MLAEPHGAAEIGPGPVAGPASGTSGWFGRYGARWARDGDRADARAAATVGDAERLVQVQVADVAAEPTRSRHADQRVEVRAVDVHLPAVLVHEVADVGDAALEDAVGRWVGDHQRGEVVGVLGDLAP